MTDSTNGRVETVDDWMVSLELYQSIVRALNEAGVSFLVAGRWSLARQGTDPPRWFGAVLIPPRAEMVARTLVAFAGIGYEAPSPIFPALYEEEPAAGAATRSGAREVDGRRPTGCAAPSAATAARSAASTPRPAEAAPRPAESASHPAESASRPLRYPGAAVVDSIKLHPGGFPGPPVVVLIKTAEGFESRSENSALEEIGPGVAVRTMETYARYDFELDPCPQALADVVELCRTWQPGQSYRVPAGKALEQDEEPFSDAEGFFDGPEDDSGAPSGKRYGLSFDAYAELAVSLNAAAIPYCLNGWWEFSPHQDPSLSWEGFVEISNDGEVARRVFAVLGRLGYAPEEPFTPEDFVDPLQAQRWIDEDSPDDDGSIRMLWFALPEDPHQEVAVATRPAAEFEEYVETALLDELAPSVPVFVLNENLLMGLDLIPVRTPQSLDRVALLDLLLKEIDAACEEYFASNCM